MGSQKKPKEPPPPAPPARATGADTAQENAEAKKKEKARFDFSKTVLRKGGLGSAAVAPNTKTTLG